jgi:hypothetical protein
VGGVTHARILIWSLLWVLVGNSLKELHSCVGDGPYYWLWQQILNVFYSVHFGQEWNI